MTSQLNVKFRLRKSSNSPTLAGTISSCYLLLSRFPASLCPVKLFAHTFHVRASYTSKLNYFSSRFPFICLELIEKLVRATHLKLACLCKGQLGKVLRSKPFSINIDKLYKLSWLIRFEGSNQCNVLPMQIYLCIIVTNTISPYIVIVNSSIKL